MFVFLKVFLMFSLKISRYYTSVIIRSAGIRDNQQTIWISVVTSGWFVGIILENFAMIGCSIFGEENALLASFYYNNFLKTI